MKYIINLYVKDIKAINREIIVDGSVPLQLFVKSLILSMHGSTNELFLLQKNDDFIEFDEFDNLSSLNLKVGDTYQIVYRYDDKPWVLEFIVLEKNKKENKKKIEIINGSMYGICQSKDMFFIKELLKSKNTQWKQRTLLNYKDLNNYIDSPFSLEENNELVNNYIEFYNEVHKSKSIIMKVSLKGFDRDIKRKIIVNNNIIIDKFCRAVITSMKGDLSHLYAIKIGKKWYDENILNEKLNFLELSVGNSFKVIYDFGDNWEFNIKVNKIIDGYNDKDFEILNGSGYGIIEDCGGVYGLSSVFNGANDYFESRDINKFNLDELQKLVDEEIKIDNLHQEHEEYWF